MKETDPKVRVDALRKFLESIKKITIVVTQVDPDALASAMALSKLARILKPEIEVSAFYCGNVSHPMNRGLIYKFGLFDFIKPISAFVPEENPDVIFVDSSNVEDPRIPKGIKLNVVGAIDHHRGGDVNRNGGKFVIIDEVGSASTILTELLLSVAEFHFDGENRNLAKMLAVGIHTDTSALTDCFARDRVAYCKVADLVTPAELAELFNYSIPLSNFELWKLALERMKQSKARLVTNIGIIPPEEADVIAEIADRMIRMDGVSLVVVWAIVGGKVRFSLRNADNTRNLEAFIAERLGIECGSKMTDAGISVGGGVMALGNLLTPDTHPELLALVDKRITSGVFA